MAVQSKIKQVFSYQTWIHAVSGAAGGIVAMTMFYPLDTVRSRLQLEDPEKKGDARSTMKVIKEIVLGEGFSALYSGLGPVLQSLCISNFVYFYAFHGLKAVAYANGSNQNALKDLLLGSIAGILNVFLTGPLWVVNTRLRMRNVPDTLKPSNEKYNNLFAGLYYIAKTEGFKALWAGLAPSLILVSNPALHFMMYESLKRHVMKITGKTEISSLGYLAIGALAKAFATVITYPLLLVQTKQRHATSNDEHPTTSHRANQSKNQSAKLLGMFEMLLDIITSQGCKGLYRGLEAKILQTVLTAALMFMAYEKIAHTVNLLLKKKSS